MPISRIWHPVPKINPKRAAAGMRFAEQMRLRTKLYLLSRLRPNPGSCPQLRNLGEFFMTADVMSSGSIARQLMSRIELRTARVCVVGLGYVGLPLAETFATAGYPVLGFDIDPDKVRKLKMGRSYIGHIASERIE